jgi:hypothetical protein
MDRLGHERWVAQGGDWGALVSSAIGRLADPAKLIEIHFNGQRSVRTTEMVRNCVQGGAISI